MTLNDEYNQNIGLILEKNLRIEEKKFSTIYKQM